jgi:hypothetical protein
VSRIILIVVIGGTLPSYTVLAHSQFNLKQSNPFEPREQPPKIVMVYNGKEYSGGLVGYSWEKTKVLDVIPEIISFERTILVAAERFLRFVKNMGKTSSFHRWWNMVSSSLYIFGYRTSHPLNI